MTEPGVGDNVQPSVTVRCSRRRLGEVPELITQAAHAGEPRGNEKCRCVGPGSQPVNRKYIFTRVELTQVLG